MAGVKVRSLAWQTDLAILRLGGSTVQEHPDALVVRTPANPGFRWGNYILVPRPPTAAEVPVWLDRYAALFPGSPHVAIGVDATNASLEDLGPLAAAGFSTEASSVLTARRVQLPPRPNLAAEVRALSSDGDWEQSLQLSLAVDGGEEDPKSYLEFATLRRDDKRRLVAQGHAMWFGAFAGSLLRAQLGVVNVGRGLARFQSVETHPAARRRGLAGTLVHYASGYGFTRLNASRLVIVADPGYPAIRIYRSVGFEDSQTQLQAERH